MFGQGAIITGWGKYRPALSLTNADLEQLVDTDDTWIRERTGIEARGMCHLETTDMAEVAARHADVVQTAWCRPPGADRVVQTATGVQGSNATDPRQEPQK